MPSKIASISFCLALAGTATLASSQDQAAKPRLPTRELGAFAAAYGVLQSSLAQQTDPKDLMLAAIRGMLYEADPDGGEFLTEETYAEFRSGPKPGLGSIGLNVQRRGLAYVLFPVVGGPAQAAGILSGDELRKIDGKDLASQSLSTLTTALPGPVGSQVTLTVFRPSAARFIDFTVSRARFENPPPTLARQRRDYVVLRLHSLHVATPTQAGELLSRAWNERAFKGVVLDLRGNPGGLLDASIAICSMFLPSGSPVAASRGRSAGANQTFQTSLSTSVPSEMKEVPLAVLVDEGTSSAAEIVAAALRDNKRARLIGRPTSGSGSIQTIQAIPDGGAIRYTIGYWESPSGRAIHRNPLLPDRTVVPANPDAELLAALDELAQGK